MIYLDNAATAYPKAPGVAQSMYMGDYQDTVITTYVSSDDTDDRWFSMLYGYLKKSKAYFDGVRVLIDGGKTFRDFIRVNKGSQRLIKKLIAEVSGIAVPIGPYEPETSARRPKSTAEDSLRKLEALGLDVTIEDGAQRRST